MYQYVKLDSFFQNEFKHLQNYVCTHTVSVYTCKLTILVSSTGLKSTIEQSKCVQANAFIQAGMFQQYNYRDSDHSVFAINLNALIVGYLSCNVNRMIWCLDQSPLVAVFIRSGQVYLNGEQH